MACARQLAAGIAARSQRESICAASVCIAHRRWSNRLARMHRPASRSPSRNRRRRPAGVRRGSKYMARIVIIAPPWRRRARPEKRNPRHRHHMANIGIFAWQREGALLNNRQARMARRPWRQRKSHECALSRACRAQCGWSILAKCALNRPVPIAPV